MKANHQGVWRRYLRWCPECEKKAIQYLKNSKILKPYRCLNCKSEFKKEEIII